MFKKILTASAFVMAAGAASATPVQWTAAMGGNDHWYEVSTGTVDGVGSAAYAATFTYSGMTGYLATIASSMELAFVRTLIGTSSTPWISGTDAAVEGTWLYNSGPEAGQVISFLPWAAGEPNDSNSNEDFLHVYTNNTYNDLYNTGWLNTVVVEYQAAPALPAVPVPAAGGLLVAGLAALGGLRRRRKAA